MAAPVGRTFDVAPGRIRWELAAALPVSRPAVSRHLRILSEAGIVRHSTEGRRHRYELDTPGLMALRTSLDQLWDLALTRYAAHAGTDEHP